MATKKTTKKASSEKLFEGYERREAKILAALKPYGIKSIEECREICLKAGFDPYKIVEETQPICFENAKWAYTVGAAMAIKKGCVKAKDAAAEIGVGLQAFCIPGSVAENRQVGRGHGNLGAMLLDDATECFAFLAGHESFAAAEGAIKIALNANKVRKTNLRVILNGLGKDAAYIISRINGFTYVKTAFNNKTEKVRVVERKAFSKGPRAAVNCYGADNVPEGVAIMKLENVGVSITGNSTNPTRFQHPVAGTYKKWCVENGKKYFSVASGGGTGRTLGPHALRRAVRRLQLGARARGDDGPHRHGQQPDGRRHGGCGRRRRGELQGQEVRPSPRQTKGRSAVRRIDLFLSAPTQCSRRGDRPLRGRIARRRRGSPCGCTRARRAFREAAPGSFRGCRCSGRGCRPCRPC